jgi:nitrate/nitrite transport system ATP-binding protein
MTPFLHIEDVSKSFKTPRGLYTAVRDISFEVKKGEFVSFIGHSGCGKSTILNMVAGLEMPTSGRITIEGRAVKGPGSDRAMVFQNYSLLPWMSVRGNVREAVDSVLEKHMAPQDRVKLVDEFLQMVGLWPHRDKLPAQLSGGMKQRVAIARAFAIRPDVLIMDEPFGALDALTKGSLHDELLRIWREGGRKQTILMVTHDIDEAIYLSDRIVVMSNGPAATVGEILDVNIPRPREKKAVLASHEYVVLKNRLIELLTETFVHAEAA